MIWFLSLLCIALYVTGVIGMGALFISIKKNKGEDYSKNDAVEFAIIWPYHVIRSLM